MGNDRLSINEAPRSGLPQRPVVSVVMANYNGAAYLAEAIQSAQAQTLCDIEIIVSDDGSTDDSVAIVTRAMADDARIHLLRSPQNHGAAAARNRALALARGEWIAVMDSDDLMHPERLARLVRSAERDGAELVTDNVIEFFQDDSMPARPLLRGHWLAGPRWIDMVEYVRRNLFYVRGPALGYLKPLFRTPILASERYDETLAIGEDYDLVVRLLHAGKKLRVYPETLYFYRRHRPWLPGQTYQEPLEALKTANERLLARLLPGDRDAIAALVARTRSIETAVLFDKFLVALRARQWTKALRIVWQRPRVAVLLRVPFEKRLRGYLRSLQPAGRDRGADVKVGDRFKRLLRYAP
jgi:succinoglycan biosynthesis protein ExoO